MAKEHRHVEMIDMDEFDPEDAMGVPTACPGCLTEIVVLMDTGEIAEPRDEPADNPVGGGPLESAFKPHCCPARPGLYECLRCGERYDDELEARNCCGYPYDYEDVVEVEGADPIDEEHSDDDHSDTEETHV